MFPECLRGQARLTPTSRADTEALPAAVRRCGVDAPHLVFPVTTVRQPVVQTGKAPSLGRESDPCEVRVRIALTDTRRNGRNRPNIDTSDSGSGSWLLL